MTPTTEKTEISFVASDRHTRSSAGANVSSSHGTNQSAIPESRPSPLLDSSLEHQSADVWSGMTNTILPGIQSSVLLGIELLYNSSEA